MKTILIPIDFSKNSSHSASYGGILAKQLNAKIIFLNVYSVPMVSEYNLATETENLIKANEIGCIEDMQAFIKNFIAQNTFDPKNIEFKVEMGFVADKIVELAQELAVDFIVMGSKGATNAFDRWIGNVAQKVKNNANCPVWVIPSKAKLSYPNQILYAANFEGKEENSIKKLLEIAKVFNAKCTAVHIHEQFELNIGHQIETMISYLEDTFEGEKINFTKYKSDEATEGLEKYIKIHKPDVLAITTHEKSLFDKLFETSVSNHFVMDANLPILCIKKEI